MKPSFIILAILLPLCLQAEKPAPTFVDLSIFISSADDHGTLIIPIKRIKNLIVIEAAVDTIAGNFVVDTGSPTLVLNSTYFRYGHLHDTRIAANATGSAATSVVQTVVDSLRISQLRFKNIEADISDLGHIENKRGIKILGLLGVGLFLGYEMIIDQHKSVLYLRKPLTKTESQPQDTLLTDEPILTAPFSLVKNIILVKANVAGKTMTFCLDTGAETNALSNSLPAKILETFQVSRRTVMLGSGGSRTEVLLGTLNEITVGQKTFLNMPAAITRLEALGSAYGSTLDGILGNPFFVKGIISINFVTHEIALYPYDVKKP